MVRRPAIAKVQVQAVDAQTLSAVTTAVLRENAGYVSPDTERILEEGDILERCIIQMLAARAGGPPDPGSLFVVSR